MMLELVTAVGEMDAAIKNLRIGRRHYTRR